MSRNLAVFFAHRRELVFPLVDPDRLDGPAVDCVLVDARVPLSTGEETGRRLVAVLDTQYERVTSVEGIAVYRAR